MERRKPKFFLTTTIALSFIFFRRQPRLWKKEFEVCALSADKKGLEDFAKEEGIDYHYIPMQREISLWSDLFCLLRFIWLFIIERPYIVHGNTPKASLLSMVAGYLTRRPIRIYMCHGLRYQGAQGRLRKLLMKMERVSCACATHVICVSKGVADTMVNDGLCKQEKIHVIGYGSAGGVDMEKFNPEAVHFSVREQYHIPNDAFVFIFIGRIVKDKGIHELVTAFNKLAEDNELVHLLLVGPEETTQNPINDYVSELIKKHDRIHAVGMQKDVRPFLKSANAFVLPSYREGFGMVLIEAGAMGLPCITTNITGCNEIVVPGENGTVVDSKNTEVLYNEMKRWVEHPEMVKKMAGNARSMVAERYECHKVWQQYWDFYKSLLESA